MDRLPASTRNYLSRVARAVFANPFSVERQDVDRELSSAPATLARGQVVDRVLVSLDARLRSIGQGSRLDLRRFGADDRELCEGALLFSLFHRYAEDFDRLIEAELAAKDRPLAVGCARALLGDLAAYGFSDQESERYLEVFWQMRRAFHFIERTLLGASSSMVRLRESLWNNLFTHDLRIYVRLLHRRMEDFSTFLVGETGTGKGTAAAAIGRSGFIPFDPRRGRFTESFVDAFLSINLSEFPATLIESELFGHKRGAFTGAIGDHHGVFQRSRPCGAIFLDEVGEIEVPVQIKLLGVLEDRSFRPVGSHETLRFEGRVIAATNRDVDELRAQGRFRDDLYYRLCSDVIRVPTLRERLAEAPSELTQLLDAIVERTVGVADRELVEGVRKVIERDLPPGYSWPGNVRELEQCVRRALVTERYSPDREPKGSGDRGERSETALLQATDDGSVSAEQLLARYCALLFRRHGAYDVVARRIGLDRRTVKRYVLAAE